MIDFEIARYGPVCQSLLTDLRPGPLGPGKPNRGFHDQLAKLSSGTLFSGRNVVDQEMADCCESGLWILHNYLDESHQVSQKIHTTTGSYWHGIMHRREPDFSNAKYWFGQAGAHPVFDELNAAAREIATTEPVDPSASFLAEQQDWDPAAFVDLCASAIQSHAANTSVCQAVALAEWQLLFDYCYRSALGL